MTRSREQSIIFYANMALLIFAVAFIAVMEAM
jgi:hypothetical protein